MDPHSGFIKISLFFIARWKFSEGITLTAKTLPSDNNVKKADPLPAKIKLFFKAAECAFIPDGIFASRQEMHAPTLHHNYSGQDK
jgi:hypothetical protein